MDLEDINDPNVRAAIAASLGDARGSEDSPSSAAQNQKQNVVDLTGESDDELIQTFSKSQSVVTSEMEDGGEEDDDLRRAIELSMQGSRDEVDLTELPDTPRESVPEPSVSVKGKAPTSMGLLGLDRKQMEEERLSRLSKRKSEDPSLDEPLSKHPRTSASLGTGRSKSPPTRRDPGSKGKMQPAAPSNKPSIQFPKETVKKAWAFGCPRVGDDIKIEEVFQQSDLELAVLSSFMWDMEWLFSKLDTRRTRFLMIMQAKEEYIKRQYESETAHMPNLRLCFPPMDGQVNCMHSKLMLLFHPGYVRIVVPTANLTPFDWGEQGGVMENSVFLIDLPRKADQGSTNTPFYEELVHFLRASTLHENIIAKLDQFDFSKTAHLAFVHTIGGSHGDEAWRRTGYCGLGRAVSSLGLRSGGPLNIDFVTSSVGSLTTEFLRSIYLAAQGDDGLTEYALRTTKSGPTRHPRNQSHLISKTTAAEWTRRFRAYFPSEQAVHASKGGPRNAGTICFQEKWFEGDKFPRHVMRECGSVREGVLMHNKIMYVRPDNPIPIPKQDNPGSSSCRAWAYIGSANLSESAWGRLVQDRTKKQPKLNCRNWECGVLVPVISQEEDEDEEKAVAGAECAAEKDRGNRNNTETNDGESAGMLDVFSGAVPVPVRLPGRRFGEEGLRPWYFTL
ncbi:hypothetical protein PHISP_06325 [Aspergillus sp. HF37]|nr:hypothetical protein PHISP_06325 [Aspergillus sp. HF37]